MINYVPNTLDPSFMTIFQKPTCQCKSYPTKYGSAATFMTIDDCSKKKGLSCHSKKCDKAKLEIEKTKKHRQISIKPKLWNSLS